tara:strand:- start:513 stop:704 length:192 start_codon:yes stop_codon:yes gene_type:complete
MKIKKITVFTADGYAPVVNAFIRKIFRKASCSNIKVVSVLSGNEAAVNNNFIQSHNSSVGYLI